MSRKPRSTTLEQAQRIVGAAAGLFSARGYPGTSMRDIAALFDLNPGSLYVYIGSKEQLLRSIVDFVADELERNMSAVESLEADPVTSLKMVARGELAVHVAYPDWYAVYNREYRHLTGDALDSVVAARRSLDARVQAILLQGERTGIFRTMSAAGELGVGIASAAFINNLHDVYARVGTVGDIGVSQFADLYADYLFSGWFARPDTR